MLHILLRNKLIKDASFNPFCDKFSYENVKTEVGKMIEGLDSRVENGTVDIVLVEKICETISLLPFFNEWYKDYYTYTLEKLNEVDYSIIDIINFQLALHNREISGVFKQVIKELADQGVDSFEKVYGHKVQTITKDVKANSRNAIELSVDAINVILNYYRFFFDTKKSNNKATFLNVINFCHNTDIRSKIYQVLKSEYFAFTWGDGNIVLDDLNRVFKFSYENTDQIIMQNIGFFRLNRNSLGPLMQFMNTVEHTPILKKELEEKFQKCNRNTQIEKIEISNGVVDCTLKSGIDEDEHMYHLKGYAEISSYYNFLNDEIIPKTPDLKVMDLVELYLPLRYLFGKIADEVTEKNEVLSFEDIGKFPTKISYEGLKSYLLSRTCYSEQQVEFFLSLLIQVDIRQRINLWDKFFLRNGEYLYFSLLPVCSSLLIYCIDTWLEFCGMDLDFRGDLFENYLQNSLRAELVEKGYFFKMPQMQKLELADGKYEEVDLLIVLKDKVILGELKCVKFPMNHIDYHNSLKRLKGGIDQAIRKMNFIIKHKVELKDRIGDINGKEIIPIVITNCSLYTGLSFKEIPIVDYFLLEAYFNTGVFGRDKIENDGTKVLNIERIEEIIFYTNEDEFGQNFHSHMKNPPAIEDLKQYIEIVDHPVTFPKEIGYSVMISGVDFKQTPN